VRLDELGGELDEPDLSGTVAMNLESCAQERRRPVERVDVDLD